MLCAILCAVDSATVAALIWLVFHSYFWGCCKRQQTKVVAAAIHRRLTVWQSTHFYLIDVIMTALAESGAHFDRNRNCNWRRERQFWQRPRTRLRSAPKSGTMVINSKKVSTYLWGGIGIIVVVETSSSLVESGQRDRGGWVGRACRAVVGGEGYFLSANQRHYAQWGKRSRWVTQNTQQTHTHTDTVISRRSKSGDNLSPSDCTDHSFMFACR